MFWADWAKVNEKALAQYVLPGIARDLRLSIARDDALAKPGGRRVVAEAIFEALRSRDIRYARPLYNPAQELQTIRDPKTILDGAGDGTCLDLALLFAGAALGNELLPIVVVLQDHAVVAISLEFGRREADAYRRATTDGDWATTGVLNDATLLRTLADDGRYLLVECTGFAKGDAIPTGVPEGVGRVDGYLPFARATAAGREQLDRADRPLQFGVDVAYLQDIGKLSPLDPFGKSLERVTPQLKRRLARIFDLHHVFGGRSAEMAQLDAFVAGPAGYMLVTGGSGSGKTALMANWIRSLEARATRIAYHFISLQHGTAERGETLLSLVQQLSYWNGVPPPSGGDAADLESAYLDLLAHPPNPVVVVIDALDEAKGWKVDARLFPPTIAANVHVLVSARAIAGRDWTASLGLVKPAHLELGPLTAAGVEEVLRAAAVPAWALDPAPLATLTDKAGGDPFYLRVLVGDLLSGAIRTAAELATRPKGVDDYLESWWAELQSTVAAQPVADLLGYLLVARGPIPSAELKDVSPHDQLSGFTFDNALDSVRRFVVGDADRGFSLSHWRFQDYLSRRVLTANDQRPYRDRLREWCGHWRDNGGRYALTFAATERLEALAEPGTDESSAVRALADLVCDSEYQRRRVEVTDAVAGLKLDVARAVQAIAQTAGPASLSVLARVAIEHDRVERAWLRPEAMLAPARDGFVAEAQRRLALFQPEEQWRDAALLLIAWLGTAVDGAAARQALQAFAADWAGPQPLPMFRDRVREAIGDGPPPVLRVPYGSGMLPAPRDEDQMQQLVAELGADRTAASGITGMAPARVQGRESIRVRSQQGDEAPSYIAEADAPELVSFAVADPVAGARLMRQYISIHAANPYADYRNRSLWAILGAVLCHPGTDWAREHTALLVSGAFAPSPIRFREGFRIAVQCRRAAGGDLAARAEFERAVQGTRDGATKLRDARWESDAWGNVCRRFASLAEAAATALDDHALANALLDEAAALPKGFAGYQAPASLTLTEANSIVRPANLVARDAALDQARSSAHNVQDPGFCARTTARVNAMREVWWAGALASPAAVIDAFVQDPFSGQFAPVHHVGEKFPARPKTDERIAIDEVTNALTLAQLAGDVFHLPLSAFERLNPNLPRNVPLGVPAVAVPDPKFAPLLAARLAAQVLADPALAPGTRVALVARLVPIALTNPTALDTVLARLVLAMPADPVAFGELLQWAPQPDADPGNDALHHSPSPYAGGPWVT